jgi:ribosomal protein S18 acetylase RimI-like enzyme
MIFGAEREGYVGWVACLDDARGNGLGDVVTRRVTNEAFDRGAPIVTLEASHFGEHTYARMGYRELYRYAVLIKL